MKGRVRAVLSALGAFVVTLALVVGVPALLIATVGNPFPSSMPTIEDIRVTLTENGDGFSNFLIGGLAVLIWFVWLQLVVALIVEVIATMRQRETSRIPTMPGIQRLAARLVASMTLATTLATAPILAPMAGSLDFEGFEPVEPISMTVDVTDAPAGAFGQVRGGGAAFAAGFAPSPSITGAHDGLTGSAAGDVADAGHTLTLDDHVELWDLAESAYGDGVTWKLIAQTNAGLVDATGSTITTETETLPAGTSVLLPGQVDVAAVASFGAVVDSVAAAQAPGVESPADAVHVIEPGDSMWSLAEAEVADRIGDEPTDAQVAEYWVDVVAANDPVPSGDADLIFPGDELILPGAGAANPGDASADLLASALPDADVDGEDQQAADLAEAAPQGGTAAPAAPAASLGGTAEQVTPEIAGAEAQVAAPAPSAAANAATGAPAQASPGTIAASTGTGRQVPVAAVGLAAFGTALLAGGLVGALRRRRDLQRRVRPPASMPALPSTEAAAFEAALAHASSDVISSEIGAGWRLMRADALDSVRAVGATELRARADGRLHAIPIDQSPDGEPWEATPLLGDRAPDLQLVHDGPGEGATTGSSSDASDAAMAVADAWRTDDLVAQGTAVAPTALIVGTDPESGDAVLLDLESARHVEVRGTPPEIRRFARSVVLDLAVSDRADDLCVIAVGVGHELSDLERVRVVDDFGGALIQAVRCGHASPDSTTPVVIISGDDVDDADALDALLELGAAVLAPGVETGVRVTLHGDHARLWPAGSTAMLASFADDDYGHVAELVEVTALDNIEPLAVDYEVHEAIDVVAPIECVVEPGPVEIRILGPVEVAGAAPFSSVKAVDVITYLAFHRQGVDADQIKTWVWPSFEPPTDKALANVLSRARTGLGTSDDGTPYLSRAGADKTYRLDATVTTDFDRVRKLIELADTAAAGGDVSGELDYLRQALDLIRGVPFTGGTASSFAWSDNHVRAHVEFTLDEAVHRCADRALEVGDLQLARWAVQKGLELVPGCEQCFRRRFLVASAGNNRTELRRAMADLERSAAAELGEPEGIDLISGDLLNLYHELDQALVAGSA